MRQKITNPGFYLITTLSLFLTWFACGAPVIHKVCGTWMFCVGETLLEKAETRFSLPDAE